jgi:HK97 family phage portal protein
LAAWRDLFRGWSGRKSITTLDLFREIYGSLTSRSGKTVNLETALQVSTVFACSRVIGNGIAQVPLKVMRKDGRSRTEVPDHPLARVLRRPNPWQTEFEFRTTMSWHLELALNFYAFKGMIGEEVRELIPIEPARVKTRQEKDLSIVHRVYSSDLATFRDFPAEAIWHVRGPSWNSYVGMDFLKLAREAIGLAIAVEDAIAGLHKNGVQASGTYSVDAKLNKEQHKDLRDWLIEDMSKNPGAPLILDRAAKWSQTQMSSVDAQTRETRRDQVEEVCRFFGVMPIMVGFSDKVATYASAESMFTAHRENCLSPRWKMWQDSMDRWLLTDRDRDQGIYTDFVEEGMLAATAKDKADVVLKLVNGGVMTPNEGREKYELDPVDGGDELREPVNVAQQQGDNADGDAGGGSSKAAPASATSVIFHQGAIQVKTDVHPGDVKVETFVEPAAVAPTIDARSEHHHHISSPITLQPAQVKTEVIMPSEMKITGMPTRESVSDTERDGKGNIARVKQTEKDA